MLVNRRLGGRSTAILAALLVVGGGALLVRGEACAEDPGRAAPVSPPLPEAMRSDDADAQSFLTVDQAPRSVFPDADPVERTDVAVTPELRTAVQARLGGAAVSIWEPTWVTWRVRAGGRDLGWAVVVDEVGKHRPITSVVGVTPDGRVKDLAVMVYREAYGGEVGQRRFLAQYEGVGPADSLTTRIRNVAGATLSVDAMSRSVKKALAIADVLWLHPAGGPSASPSPVSQ